MEPNAELALLLFGGFLFLFLGLLVLAVFIKSIGEGLSEIASAIKSYPTMQSLAEMRNKTWEDRRIDNRQNGL